MQQRIVYVEGEDVIDIIPAVQRFSGQQKREILDDEALADNISACPTLISLRRRASISATNLRRRSGSGSLDRGAGKHFDAYRSDSSNETVEFEQPYDFRRASTLLPVLVDTNELIDMVTSQKQGGAHLHHSVGRYSL